MVVLNASPQLNVDHRSTEQRRPGEPSFCTLEFPPQILLLLPNVSVYKKNVGFFWISEGPDDIFLHHRSTYVQVLAFDVVK